MLAFLIKQLLKSKEISKKNNVYLNKSMLFDLFIDCVFMQSCTINHDVCELFFLNEFTHK